MRKEPYLFELSGEHPQLPRAEVLACLEAETGNADVVEDGPGFVVARMTRTELPKVGSRLALSHRLGSFLGDCKSEELDGFLETVDLPSGSISVRVKRFQGVGSPDLSNEIMKRAGAVLSRGRTVNLGSANVKIRVLISDRLLFYLDEIRIDRCQFEARHVRSRPFFSPISLHPRYARALVNLTRVKPGQTLLDPFCGTGGVLLEAATMGVRAFGSDISPEMIAGCRENMAHLGIPWEKLEVIDIGDIESVFGKVDAVATDPPYGRSATTRKEPARDLHLRALDAIAQVLGPSSMAGVVLPQQCSGTKEFKLEASYEQRVHRSLTRHYCLLKRHGH
jgi:tRNA (guanine10-N2)-dimethyltransferase